MKKKTQKTVLMVGAILAGGFIAWKYLLPIIGITGAKTMAVRRRLTAEETPPARIVVTPKVIATA